MSACQDDPRCFRSDRHTGPHAYPDDPASQKRAEEWIRQQKVFAKKPGGGRGWRLGVGKWNV